MGKLNKNRRKGPSSKWLFWVICAVVGLGIGAAGYFAAGGSGL